MNVCIVGGGPAGMMLGFLLARSGIEVAVLEKHKDFLRDFRGDTIHPSTLELMHELGVLEEFLQQPHQKVEKVGAQLGDAHLQLADFAHLPVQCKYIALMPQWDFLNFLAAHAKGLLGFHLHLETEATDLILENNKVMGVKAKTPQGPVEFRAGLVVGADGRGSTMRTDAGLEVIDIGAPMDVLWMRISRQPDDPEETLGRVKNGYFMVTINRGSYWQCAFLIPKGTIDEVREKGLPAFREGIAVVAPFMRERLDEIKDWDQIKLLTVKVDRLKKWHRPGLLCIGDSAHAMSPVGGVGINLAIQDAVATANLLEPHLQKGVIEERHLAAVQERRTFPTKMTQAMQVFIQNRVINRVLGDARPVSVPLAMRLLQWFPVLRRIPARIVGLGFRPEHIRTPARSFPSRSS
jgi:2-polyprenyl-6-methoxyphenol hydroxylase-like FAD-dependent oxidoreductase